MNVFDTDGTGGSRIKNSIFMNPVILLVDDRGDTRLHRTGAQ